MIYDNSRRRIILFLFILFLISSAFPATPSYVDPSGYPAAWPDSSWIGYTYFLDFIEDKEGSIDGSNGGTTPNGIVDVTTNNGLPSVSYYGDGDVLFLRIILAGSPSTKSADPYGSATWNLLIDTDGDGYKEFVVLLNGSDVGVAPDDIEIYYSDSQSQSYEETDLIWSQDSAVGDNNNVDGETGSKSADWGVDIASSVWDFGRTRVSTIVDKSIYALDIQIPISALDASSSGGIAIIDSPRMAFAFTSSNSNTDPTQKDFVYSGDFAVNPAYPIPFGDITDIYGNICQDPYFAPGEMTASGCGEDVQICANVIDTAEVTISGEVISSVQSVEYYYYFDRNNNALADDGMEWVTIGNATLTGNINPWTLYSWNTTGLVQGQYIIKGIAKDKKGNVTDS